MNALRKPSSDRRLRGDDMRRLLDDVIEPAQAAGGERRQRRSRSALAALIVAGALGGAFVLTRPGGEAVGAGTAEPQAAAPAEAPRPTAPGSVLDASGYVVASRRATVSSETTGRLAAVFVTEGMRVRRGQVLARLDTRDVDQQVALAEAQVTAAVRAKSQQAVDLEAALDRYDRLRRLREQGFTTEADFRTAEFNVQRLRAAQATSDSDIAIAQRRLMMQRQFRSNADIIAPFDGLVTETAAQVGEIVSPISAGGGFTRTGICTLVDIGSIEVRVQVNERYIGRIREGQAVEIVPRAYPQIRLAGEVATIMPAASRETGAVEVIVAFLSRDERVLPNMSVDVSFRDQQASARPAESDPASGRRS